jgi:hypothetical protein
VVVPIEPVVLLSSVRTRTLGDLHPLNCLASGADETPSPPQSTLKAHKRFTLVQAARWDLALNPTSSMSELIDEDVAGVCTKSLVAAEMGFRPPNLAGLGLVYSLPQGEEDI